MKIQINSSGHEFSISLPTKLIFSKFVIRMVLKDSRAAAGLENLPPEAAERIVAELRNIKDTYGSWELVEVCSADGENVKITL